MDIKSQGISRCAATLCTNNSKNCEFSFFRFPKDSERARSWAIACNRDDLINKKNLHNLSYKICGKHFENIMFLNDLHNRLQTKAVPTIFPAQESTSSSSAKEHVQVKTEDNTECSTDVHPYLFVGHTIPENASYHMSQNVLSPSLSIDDQDHETI